MTRYRGQPDFRHGTPPQIGVLVTNLGTPEAPTASALRRYLGEFLWDPRVVEMPRPLWWLILHGIVLRTRPRKSAEAYRRVWTDDGSPLLAIARRQQAAIQDALAERLPGPVKVALGMRYGQPSIEQALIELQAANCQRLLVLPLYPQYSGATTASSFDAVSQTLQSWRWVPELRFINHYHDLPAYIDALAASIREYWQAHGQGQRLLFSFHGMPRRTLRAGDPYHCQCQKTAHLVAERLGLVDDQWAVAFQSRFGREEWLKPYTDKTLASWAEAGMARVDVICPGFSADCLETLEEIAMTNRDAFLAAGGQALHYIPCLNDRTDHMQALAALAAQHCQGWPEASSEWNASAVQRALADSRARAQAMGGT